MKSTIISLTIVSLSCTVLSATSAMAGTTYECRGTVRTDAFGLGSTSTSAVRIAQRNAPTAWAAKARATYGNRFAGWPLAKHKRVRCDRPRRTGIRWSARCTVSATACTLRRIYIPQRVPLVKNPDWLRRLPRLERIVRPPRRIDPRPASIQRLNGFRK